MSVWVKEEYGVEGLCSFVVVVDTKVAYVGVCALAKEVWPCVKRVGGARGGGCKGEDYRLSITAFE